MKFLTYILVPIIALGLLFASCEKEDNSSMKNVQGHWVYSSTKAEIFVTDPSLKVIIENYIAKKLDENTMSYEFNNDKTYYYYQNYEEPLKGIYKSLDKNTFILDDSRGLRSVMKDDSMIYVVSDLKSEIVEKLNIDERKIIKVSTVDTFERGLSEK
ncbi:hypothetical protein GGR21_002020 [Dysgonomonas hofstadii]|uniref:Lipocalin-like domain-containing protein n=1 Tax=Dysgonomonas hofstadii TaxID=637886 RepID=A0A840CN56_9BACT|nr:hypothetical protein [Dysgonomonas hofstadii]MBB4036119.1 hypothetical protein [Dysgonomonas hofstadii]